MRSEKKRPRQEGTPDSDANGSSIEHTTVLLRESVDLLRPRSGGVYVDGTLGGGGHAGEILRRSSPDGILIGLDQDVDAVRRCGERLAEFGRRAVLRQANFRCMAVVLRDLGIDAVDGILLDLGLSWFHLRSPERGFSFRSDGPLDMRMDAGSGATAADLVNTLSRAELARILREYGEEKKANAIAKAIELARSRGPITSTLQLARVVSSVFPPYPPRRTHPATLTFQALRIAVNDELGALRDVLGQAVSLLRPGGRVAVITFHSLEDRIVKQTFAEQARACVCPPRFPVCRCDKRAELAVVTRRPVTPAADEVRSNPASRSAKLRAAEKRTAGQEDRQI
jgi:16S rRNA (cytosine1402-N4)-methyltransferase